MSAYLLKYNNKNVEYREFDYSKTDSSFYSLNFDRPADSSVKAVEYKTKELPKGKININRAGIEELTRLPGIGVKTAEKILEYKKQIKIFKNTSQLKNVKGISTGKYNKLKDYIIIE